MKLTVDENIPQGKEAFGKFGEIVLSNGRKITNDMLKDTDVLIVRSITNVNRELLKNTNVRFVGTATIGTDHIDKEYLANENIRFADAAGCNAYSVAEYIICSMLQYLVPADIKFKDTSIGIIGCGNVGSKVAGFVKSLGMKVFMNDPPLQRKGGDNIYCSFDDAAAADIVTFHVPLNKTGIDKTYHLLNETNIDKIKSGALLINSSRGPVIKNDALLKRLKDRSDLFTVLDVWENEPNFDPELLKFVNYGTPHIAGYSFEGKMNGTKIIHDKLCEFLNSDSDWQPLYPEIEKKNFQFNSNNNFEIELNKLTKEIYGISFDSDNLKKSLSFDNDSRGKYFDELRKKYYTRREFNNYSVEIIPQNEEVKNKLKALRFNIK